MSIADQKRLLRNAEIRAIRALRIALSALFDARADIVANFAGDPGDEPEEIEQTRVAAWNTMRALLFSAAKDIETFAKFGGLGADYTARTISLCEDVLKALDQDDRERMECNTEALRPDTDKPIQGDGLLMEATEKLPESERPAGDESEK